MKFSFTLLLSGMFLAYVLHSIYSIIQIYIPPSCNPTEQQCLKSFLSTKPQLQLILCTSPDKELKNLNQLTLIDNWKKLEYTGAEPIVKNITISVPLQTRQNGSLYIYGFAAEVPSHKESWKQSIGKSSTMSSSFELTKYLVPAAETYNLLRIGENQKTEVGKGLHVTHITKKLRLGMMTELHLLNRKELPFELAMLIKIITYDTYLPPLRFDKFSSRISDFYKVNETEESYELEFAFVPATIGNIRMASQFEMAMSTMKEFGFSDKDLDEVKGIFCDTNIYLLAITMFVASIHLLFDFLAFKNDVSFWKARKSTAGLSSSSIFWRCFSQIIVFIYLLEEKSSVLITAPAGIGSLIEVWKVTKVLKMRLKFQGFVPTICFDSATASERESATHDNESLRYLSYVMYPLLIGGAIYSLLYTSHKSFYSWTIQSLVNGVYAFGFLFMLPQLFINYKLKTVAHLPWRSFMYKAFNTFIDDLFAFIIVMPTAHRVACFRDDIVFLIYLYQRWLYPVDKTRIDVGGEFELKETEPIHTVEKKTN